MEGQQHHQLEFERRTMRWQDALTTPPTISVAVAQHSELGKTQAACQATPQQPPTVAATATTTTTTTIATAANTPTTPKASAPPLAVWEQQMNEANLPPNLVECHAF